MKDRRTRGAAVFEEVELTAATTIDTRLRSVLGTLAEALFAQFRAKGYEW